MLIDFISDLLSDSAIPSLLVIAVVVIFDKKLIFRQYFIIFIVTLISVMIEHGLLRFTNENNLRGFLIFLFAASIESGELFGMFAYACKGEILSRLYIIFALYLQMINGVVGYICGLSDTLAYAIKAHIILREPAPILPIALICILHIVIGILLAVLVRKLTLNRQRFHSGMYQWIALIFICLITILGTIRHGYYNVLAKKENAGSITQVVIITSITFVIMIIIINALLYLINLLEVKRMHSEQLETEKWLDSIIKHYHAMSSENREIKNEFENEFGNMKEQEVLHRALKNQISLTGNIMLDTLFVYYHRLAREKDIVFEMQVNIEAGIMNKTDMVTISDKVLSLYFDEAERGKGYIFVHLRFEAGRLILNYEMNRELGIDRLSFGTCRKYRKLNTIRRIVYLKNGIANCKSESERQRISVMFIEQGHQ